LARNDLHDRARRYHDDTAHSPHSVRTDAHWLDWDVKPSPFKVYPDLPRLELPRAFPPLTADTLASLSAPVAGRGPLDLEHLTALLFFSAGVTKVKTYPGGGEVYFRAAASTGALYQTEVYVVAGAVEGLPAGVYHFSPGDLSLRQLRAGDFRGAVARAGADPLLALRPATVILTAIYWRNTWKYRARGYRHLFWDAGTMLANTLAAGHALGLHLRLSTGFVDSPVNALLGLDPAQEAALVLVPVGEPAGPAPPPVVVSTLRPVVLPLSSSAVDCPLLREAYADSCLDSEAAVIAWREAGASPGGAPPPPPTHEPLAAPRLEVGSALGQTIRARGSTREFSGEALSEVELSTALYHATRGIAADVRFGLVELYLAIHAVGGVAPGAYRYHPDAHALECLRTGDVRADAAFLCLQQPLGGSSSATVFFLADLRRVLPALGNRGYRLVNLEAGLIGGRLYLGAYGQGFGATGLTFYDGAVVGFFAPHAAGKDAVFVTALGRAIRRPARVPAPLRTVTRPSP
jgi:SagB-type dehydrogenase family enzyme